MSIPKALLPRTVIPLAPQNTLHFPLMTMARMAIEDDQLATLQNRITEAEKHALLPCRLTGSVEDPTDPQVQYSECSKGQDMSRKLI